MKPYYQNFEETFQILLQDAKKEPISIHTFLTTLSGKGKILLLIFLSLGFAQIPGIAIFLGLFITYLGIRIAIGKDFIWMPKFIRQKKIASYLVIKIINQTLSILKFLKRWSKPRYERLTNKNSTRVANGLMIAVVGLCLASSPPVPLTGLLASAAIFMIAIGLLNNDGIYIFLGYICVLLHFVTVLLLLYYFSFVKIFRWIYHIFTS